MPNNIPFGHALKILLLSGCAALMSACATTTPSQDRAPIVQRPVDPVQPIPTETKRPAEETPETKEVEVEAPPTPSENEPVENEAKPPVQTAESGPYFNNREGLTPPHMAGRDTKRLALFCLLYTSPSPRDS